MKNYIIDSHCHLDLIEKHGINLETIVKNAEENNVKILQTICTKISEIDKILHYTKLHDFIYASVGNHPCNIDEEAKITSQEIISICNQHEKIIGIGETGLDYYHPNFNKITQTASFIEHIKASQENNLPVIIHSRNADDDMAQILKSEKSNKDFPALLHCFTSSEELAKAALDLGIYISISGIVTFKNATQLQEIVKFIPLDMLLVETDAPYLAPNPYRGKTNQPAFVKNTVEFIAELKKKNVEEVANTTTENFFRIFTKCREEKGTN